MRFTPHRIIPAFAIASLLASCGHTEFAGYGAMSAASAVGAAMLVIGLGLTATVLRPRSQPARAAARR